MQEAYLELQILSSQIKQLRGQVQLLDEQAADIAGVIQNIDDFGSSEVGSEMLAPISGGIFAKADLKDNKELVVNVGADIAVEKDLASTKQLLAERLSEVQRQRDGFVSQLQGLSLQAQQAQQTIEKFVK